MSNVATLIANPACSLLVPSLADKAARALGASDIIWLSADVAADIAVPEGLDETVALARLRDIIGDTPVDIVVQNAGKRRKKLLIADMDSTMINQECIDELAAEIGLKEQVAEITARSMNGELNFEASLRERVALLEGIESTVIKRIIENRITLAAGGKILVATMNANGAWTALVSGGFLSFTGPVAAKLGFQEHRANILLEENGQLTGKVSEPILGRAAKATALNDMSERLGISPDEAIAVGDGANDLDMLLLAGSGVALHAKPAVAAQARMRIDHGDLSALLFIQGYRQEEFIK